MDRGSSVHQFFVFETEETRHNFSLSSSPRGASVECETTFFFVTDKTKLSLFFFLAPRAWSPISLSRGFFEETQHHTYVPTPVPLEGAALSLLISVHYKIPSFTSSHPVS